MITFIERFFDGFLYPIEKTWNVITGIPVESYGNAVGVIFLFIVVFFGSTVLVGKCVISLLNRFIGDGHPI